MAMFIQRFFSISTLVSGSARGRRRENKMIIEVGVAKTFHISCLFVYVNVFNVNVVRSRVVFLDRRVLVMLQVLLNCDLLPFRI